MIEQHASITEKFIKKGAWLYLFSFIIAPLGYIIKIIVSGHISVSELGVLYGVLSLITLLSSFNDFGMTESLNFFIPKYIAKNNYSKVKTTIALAFLTQIITGIIITLLLFFGAPYLGEYYFKSQDAVQVIYIFCFYFIGINIFQVFNTFFTSVQNTFYSRITEFLRMSFILICTLIFTFLDLGNIYNYVSSWMIGLYFGIIFVLYFFYTRYYKKYLSQIPFCFSKALFKETLSYASMVFLAAQAGTLLSQMDMQMIIFFLSSSDAGYYTAYLSIITIPFMAIGPIFGLLFPLFSQLSGTGDIQKIKQIKQIMQKNFIALALAFNIFFFIFSLSIATILFGENFKESGLILKYSILFLVFNFLLQINFNILAGIGRVKTRLKIILIAILFNFIGNIILINGIAFFGIPSFGVYGAALATAFGWILIWVLSELSLAKEYFSHFDYKFFTKNIFFLGILGFFCYSLIVPFLEKASRIAGMGILSFVGILWFGAFILFNWNDFRGFILEIKRLKR